MRHASAPIARRGSGATIALGTLVVIASLALLAPWIAPYDPAAQLDLALLANRPPSLAHPLGTDSFSRDMLSRSLFGARASMSVAVVATLVATVVGAAWGAVAALAPSQTGAALMSTVDVVRSVPRVLVLLTASVLLGALPPLALGLLLGLSVWPGVCRLVFTLVRSLGVRPFVEAATALGSSRFRVLVRHVAPALVGPLAASGALLFADTLALEAGLSFIGLGVKPPNASWGSMVQDALPYLESAWWVALVPCACVVFTVLAAARLVDTVTEQH